MGTDEEWEKWGSSEPYFGVLTDDKFKLSSLNEHTKEEFFRSGKERIDQVMEICTQVSGQKFMPKTALDFGCGVGRLVLPLAEICDRVVGVDISESMLKHARTNAADAGLKNVDFRLSDDKLSAVPEAFDLVHTYIVLQHIPLDRGMEIFSQLVDRVAPEGIGSIHLTYAKTGQLFERFERIPLPERSRRKLWSVLRSLKKTATARGSPQMEMNHYDLNAVLKILQARGARKLHVEFTVHGGELGIQVTFQKPKV